MFSWYGGAENQINLSLRGPDIFFPIKEMIYKLLFMLGACIVYLHNFVGEFSGN